jgi:hypothetical protein
MSLPRAGRLANVMQRAAAEVGATADEPFVPVFPAVVAPSPAPGPSLPCTATEPAQQYVSLREMRSPLHEARDASRVRIQVAQSIT